MKVSCATGYRWNKNAGDLEEATRAFRDLMGMNPDYSAAYFHGGQAAKIVAPGTHTLLC
jgi:hypothetical protein